ncbi:unnamed protein product [Orchesella dallaii]|uniref:AB hydrolase-1 domain-containing protein n=1 Tax=Orchesella dallaii TaxID=48710 RepID=A0ABP1PWN2_9HEXA
MFTLISFQLAALLSFIGIRQFCAGQLFNINSVLNELFPEDIYQGQRSRSPICVHDIPSPIHFEEESERMNCYQEVSQRGRSPHPDQNKRTNEVLAAYDYDMVTYDNVITKDGYTLTLFRIRGNKKSPPKIGKPVVLLFHGLGTASDQWVLQYGDRNLAFKLADAGYEVWLANARGTDYSRQHTKLNAERDIEYWNFSFHEIALYDFPAILDVISSETGEENIYFIGHSMGGAVYAIALAEMPELNQRVRAGFLLAPAIFLGHSYSPYRILQPILELPLQMQAMINRALRGRLEGSNPTAFLSPAQLCTPTAMRCDLCGNAIFFLYGYDGRQLNFTNVPNILSKIFNTHSFKTLLHFGQNFRSCLFRKYDYGRRANLKMYGQVQPPSYSLHKIVAPTYIYYGDSDNFVPPIDVATTRDALPPETVQGYSRVNWTLFNHVDFMVAKDADVLVYNGILEILEDYKFGRRK